MIGWRILVGLAMLPYAAAAQTVLPPPPYRETPHHVAVTERILPGYQPTGIRIGTILLNPTLDLRATYDDNIFAVESGRLADVIARIEPGLVVQGGTPAMRLSLYGRAQIDRYADNSSEDREAWSAGATGAFELGRFTRVSLGVQQRRDIETRQSQNAFTLTRAPIDYEMTSTAAALTQTIGSFELLGEGQWSDTSYGNAVLIDGTPLDLRGRDNDRIQARGRATYNLSPSLGIFGQARYNRRDYGVANGLLAERDSTGYDMLVGARFDATAPFRGEVSIGYLKQDFRSADYADFSGFAISADMAYFPTQLTTITLSADRSVADSGIPGVAGYLVTQAGVKIDHELLRQLILSAGATYERNRFNGTERRDERTGLTATASYRMNPLMTLKAGYDRVHLTSSTDIRQFTNNRLYLSLLFRK